MYKRVHHRRVARLLSCLNHSLLQDAGCQFGGGTAMTLLFGEHREARGLVFLVNQKGFAEIRSRIYDEGDGVLFSERLRTVSELRYDQYGIRTALTLVDGSDIAVKFQIVLEGRIELDAADASRSLDGIPLLGMDDLLAEKLLANSDRWADPSVFSRDLIDLAMIPDGLISARSLEKADRGVQSTVREDLQRAKENCLSKQGWLRICIDELQIDLPEAALYERIKRLSWPKVTP